LLRRLSILLVAVVLVITAAGCGGGDESSASGDTMATETSMEETTTGEATASSDTDTDIDSGTGFNWASEDCQSLVKAYIGLSAAIGAATTGQDVSGDVEAFTKYVDEVPDEIKADVQTLASAYSTFLDELKGLGLQPGQVPSADQIQALDKASKELGTSDIQAASDRMNAWTTANCK